MAMEREFIEKGMRNSQIDEFLASELERAGYGGMDMARTPMGTEITLRAEKPGMVIGKGGKNIRELTDALEQEFDLEDLQIDVQEVDQPDLNARIVADKLANALERGWYFRDAGQTTLRRIMDSGARGAEIIFSGKITGARARVEKFSDGYIKHCGEPAEEIVERGQATAIMKLGSIGVQISIIPPEAELPDNFEVRRGVDVEDKIPGVKEEDIEVTDAETQPAEPSEEEEIDEEEAEEEPVEEEPEPETEEAEEEGVTVPDTYSGFEELSYRELQKLAMEKDIKATLKKEELIEKTSEAFGVTETEEEEEPGGDEEDEEEVEDEEEETDDEVDSEPEPDEEAETEEPEVDETRDESEQETDESEEPDEEPEVIDGVEVPGSAEGFEELAYNELQKLAMEKDIKATQKKDELIEQTRDAYLGDKEEE